MLICGRPVYPHPAQISSEPYRCITASHVAATHPKTYWKHITHASKKKKLLMLCWCTKSFPLLVCLLLKQDASLLLITLTPFLRVPVLPLQSLPLYIPVSSLCLVVLCLCRQDLSSSGGTSKCPSLCGLFREADNDIPNPAVLQLIALFRRSPSTIIPCPQPPPLFTSSCAASIAKCSHICSIKRPRIFYY